MSVRFRLHPNEACQIQTNVVNSAVTRESVSYSLSPMVITLTKTMTCGVWGCAFINATMGSMSDPLKRGSVVVKIDLIQKDKLANELSKINYLNTSQPSMEDLIPKQYGIFWGDRKCQAIMEIVRWIGRNVPKGQNANVLAAAGPDVFYMFSIMGKVNGQTLASVLDGCFPSPESEWPIDLAPSGNRPWSWKIPAECSEDTKRLIGIVCHAIAELHRRNLAHGDIHGENIMVEGLDPWTSWENVAIKFIDIGNLKLIGQRSPWDVEFDGGDFGMDWNHEWDDKSPFGSWKDTFWRCSQMSENDEVISGDIALDRWDGNTIKMELRTSRNPDDLSIHEHRRPGGGAI